MTPEQIAVAVAGVTFAGLLWHIVFLSRALARAHRLHAEAVRLHREAATFWTHPKARRLASDIAEMGQ